MLQDEHDAGVHETLTYLEPYSLSRDGVPLAFEPFDTEMHYDFVARRDGATWPDETGDGGLLVMDPTEES